MSVKSFKVENIKAEKVLGGPIKAVITPATAGSKKIVYVHGTFKPGEGLVPHIHPESEEIYLVISGNGTVYEGKEKKEIGISAGTALYIPAGIIHYVRNTGKTNLDIAFFLSPGTEQSVEVH